MLSAEERFTSVVCIYSMLIPPCEICSQQTINSLLQALRPDLRIRLWIRRWLAITPSWGATISFSIFIASRITTTWPLLTRLACAGLYAKDLSGHGSRKSSTLPFARGRSCCGSGSRGCRLYGGRSRCRGRSRSLYRSRRGSRCRGCRTNGSRSRRRRTGSRLCSRKAFLNRYFINISIYCDCIIFHDYFLLIFRLSPAASGNHV